MVVVGIDLGTAYSSIAVSEDGQTTVIENDQGARKIPSVVAFTNNERLIGEAALNQKSSNPSNTILNVKRIIGQRYTSFEVRKNMQSRPYRIEDEEGAPVIQAKYKGENKRFFAEEITAMILTKLKETTENRLGKEVTGAVITVPANFTASQRRATQQAALIARIPVEQLISEPIAAAITFSANNGTKERRNVLMFHLGAGYFSATVLSIEHGVYSVKSVVGNSNIGGEEFSDRIVNHFTQNFFKEHNRQMSPRERARLRSECEKVKIELGNGDFSTSIKIDAFSDSLNFEDSITWNQFVSMTQDLWGTMRDSVKLALKNAMFGVLEIDDVVATGSATRMPMITEVLVQQCGFDAAKLRKTINMDEAAVTGAAALAAVYGQKNTSISAVNGITSNAFLVRKEGDDSFIVGHGTSLPLQCTYNISRSLALSFTVYEMELLPTWEFTGVVGWHYVPHQIGKYHESVVLDGDTKHETFETMFKLDKSGMLEVQSSGVTLIEQDGLSQDAMKKLITESGHYQADDQMRDNAMKKLHKFERGVYDLQTRLKFQSCFKLRNEALAECDKKERWIKENKNPSVETVDEKLHELEVLCERVFAKSPQNLRTSPNWRSEYQLPSYPPHPPPRLAPGCPRQHSPASHDVAAQGRQQPG